MDPESTGAPVQPSGDEGQGGLTEHLLSAVPEEHREIASNLLSEWDKAVQKKFTEHAEYRKQWEPYEQLGLTQIPQEELADLLAFREVAADPDKFREWYAQIGQMLGEATEGDADLDIDEGDTLSEDDDSLSAIEAELKEFREWRQQQERERKVNEAAAHIRSELDAIKKDHPDLTEEDEEVICTFALKYDGKDAIRKGFQDFQNLIGRAEKRLFKSKSEQPEAPNTGGSADTAPQPLVSFEDAAKAARQRLAQARSL